MSSVAAVDPPPQERPTGPAVLEDTPARAREEEAEEDPLTKRQQSIQRAAETTPAKTPAKEPNALSVYGSLRVRYRATPERQGIEDGSSRVGIQGRYQLFPQRWISARGEAGFKLLDEVSALANGNSPSGGRGDSFFPRLHYLSYESPNLFLVLGKTWSVYYKVTSFTDRFAGTGGQAAGTYNAGTDGGRTGTGRADDAIQTRIQLDLLPRLLGFEPLSLNVQVQNGQAIPDAWSAHYGLALGISTLLATTKDFSLGVAYHHAEIPEQSNGGLRALGIHGNAEALAIGARWLDDDWYLGTVFARLRNHETTDQGRYFDGRGWELYAQRRLSGRWWGTLGWNWLQPDGGQPLAGDYRLKYGVVGLRYALKDFERYVYGNLKLESSIDEDGSHLENVLTVGLRWNF
ncbi:porin [Thiorhodococcus minor]|uniref:Porin n=1 Tax=Thiorhodococcus minor TaxID=57489 RepID=A0A6M0K5C5_9GAMM|nr:porin [Thiorhodococcus minor]